MYRENDRSNFGQPRLGYRREHPSAGCRQSTAHLSIDLCLVDPLSLQTWEGELSPQNPLMKQW